MPKKVLHLLLDLRVFENPQEYYLFSSNIKPGEKQVSRRMLSKHWDKMRKKLKISEEYQYYSLKDTGITDMLTKKVSNIAVRDQARHSSLSITNIYARAIDKDANEEILNLEGEF
jgi:site-specific recombinase XerC